MTKLEYTFKNDILFKLLFVKHQNLLQRLVSELLEIEYDSITQFEIINPEILPENLGDKFCRLDINMVLDGQLVDLEIQVNNEGDYPERSLYYWAKGFSSSLKVGEDYSQLPRTIVISILAFKLFDCTEFHSEYRSLEVTRHNELTDKMSLHYFELPKLSDSLDASNTKELWLKLFKAETEEEIAKIEALGVPIMEEAVTAYRHVATSPEVRERERLWEKARHDEAQALNNARKNAKKEERELWQGVVAEKDMTIAEKDTTIAEKDTTIAEKDALIAELEAKLNKNEQSG